MQFWYSRTNWIWWLKMTQRHLLVVFQISTGRYVVSATFVLGCKSVGRKAVWLVQLLQCPHTSATVSVTPYSGSPTASVVTLHWNSEMAHITIASIRSPCVRNVSKHFQLLHTLCFGPGNQLGLFMLQILMSLGSQLFVTLLVHHHSEWMSISTLCYKSFSKKNLPPQPPWITHPKNKTECK